MSVATQPCRIHAKHTPVSWYSSKCMYVHSIHCYCVMYTAFFWLCDNLLLGYLLRTIATRQPGAPMSVAHSTSLHQSAGSPLHPHSPVHQTSNGMRPNKIACDMNFDIDILLHQSLGVLWLLCTGGGGCGVGICDGAVFLSSSSLSDTSGCLVDSDQEPLSLTSLPRYYSQVCCAVRSMCVCVYVHEAANFSLKNDCFG